MDYTDLWFINSYRGTDSIEDFGNAVISICNTLGINPNYLMLTMWIESRLSPQAVNKTGWATGLIQFMPDTAVGLGTTTAALLQMSGTAQLQYVELYFQNVIKQYGVPQTPEAVYLSVFFPLAVANQDNPDWVLQTSTLSASLIAQENPLYANDGQITIGDVANYVASQVPGTIAADVAVTVASVENNWVGIVIAAVGIIGLTFFLLELHKNKAIKIAA